MLIKRGDIFFANLNLNNEKSEIGGLRPVIILQNDVANKYLPTTIIAPLTSSTRIADLPTHILISKDSGLKKDNVILLEQIRAIDKMRLVEKVGHVNKEIIEKLNDALNIATTNNHTTHEKHKTDNYVIQSLANNNYEFQYKDIYSTIKDIKDIKRMLTTSNYISNKIRDWIFSGIIGAVIGAGLTLLIAVIN